MKKTFINFLTALCAASMLFISCKKDEDESVKFVAPPAVDVPAGDIDYGTVVSFSCETPDVEFYYTVNKKFYPSNYEAAGTIGSKITIYTDCTVYVIAAKGGTPSEARSYEYKIRTGTQEVYNAEDGTPLTLGNPSGATNDPGVKENYLLAHDTYTLSFNDTTHNPNWVSWYLDKSYLGSADRSDSFRRDTLLPDTFYAVTKDNYQFNEYGFDRGHMCPSGDRTATDTMNKETFFMTNMVPQSAANNQIVWMNFENYERKLAADGKEVYIICGPYGTGGTSKTGSWSHIKISTLKDDGIVVPATTWKILLVLEKGTDDISRIENGEGYTIAINVPNTETCYTDAKAKNYTTVNAWQNYIVTVDEIETLTGYDFFSRLSSSAQTRLESAKYIPN